MTETWSRDGEMIDSVSPQNLGLDRASIAKPPAGLKVKKTEKGKVPFPRHCLTANETTNEFLPLRICAPPIYLQHDSAQPTGCEDAIGPDHPSGETIRSMSQPQPMDSYTFRLSTAQKRRQCTVAVNVALWEISCPCPFTSYFTAVRHERKYPYNQHY